MRKFKSKYNNIRYYRGKKIANYGLTRGGIRL